MHDTQSQLKSKRCTKGDDKVQRSQEQPHTLPERNNLGLMANTPILLLRLAQHPHSLTLLISSRQGIKRRRDASNRILFEHCVRNDHTTRVDPHHNVGLTRSNLVTKQIICIKTRQTYAQPFVASVGTSVCMTPSTPCESNRAQGCPVPEQ